MRRDLFHYDLPPDLIAAHPARQRDESRLMLVPRHQGAFSHHRFNELPHFLREGDCLVLNDSRVIPARLAGRKESGGRVELLLLHPFGERVWEAMVRPARKLIHGARIALPGEGAWAVVEEVMGERTRRIRLEMPLDPNGQPTDVLEYLDRHGRMPLPPYILHQRKQHAEADYSDEDRERYQTVYATMPGSVAAPTAGLHFTPELLDALRQQGIEIRRVTLHVGLGTFEPVTVEDLRLHQMHSEFYEIDEANATAIETARRDPARRVIAVGTTSVRTLEACYGRHSAIRPVRETTDIFIYPGYSFAVIDGMITNFHLPESTLLMLVAAFAGRERILAAYREAIERQYRFYSYGDGMLIV